MKSNAKKKIIVIVVSFLVLALIVGVSIAVIYFIKESKKDSDPIEVVSVSMLSGGYYNSSTISGSIVANSQQNIYANASSQVKEVFVKVGDEIKVGDPLVQYDTTSNSLQLETQRTGIEVLKSQVKQAEKKLEQLKKTVPIEDLPPAPEPPEPDPVQSPTDASTQVPQETTVEDPANNDNLEEQINEEETYTKEELKKAIADKEKEIKDLKLQVEMDQLQYDIALKAADNGTITSTCSGVVQTVNDFEESIASGEPFIVIGGNTGYTLTGQVSEWDKAKIEIGMTGMINCYDNSMMYDGIVTGISDIPVEGGYGQGTSSYYLVSFAIDTDDEIPQYAWAEVTMDQGEATGDEITIFKAYVREENGQKYVLKAVDGRLKKQYVKTGKVLWGTEVEITSGLTLEDQIAFPYGKDAVEGKVVKESSDNYYY